MGIKAVFGGAGIPLHFNDKRDECLAALKNHGVTTIDTARLYEGSEEAIGSAANHEHFIIDTKLKGGLDFSGVGGTTKPDAILRDVQDSLQKCKIKQFDILYIHAPDKTSTVAELVEGINEAHKKGYFKRFGLSNYSAEQVQEVYDAAKSKGYVLPSVYQGNYNPVKRGHETSLMPTLRKLGFSYYAYSPLAGGFLVKTEQQLDEGAGRFNNDALLGMYNKIYNTPLFREALREWNDIAAKEGVSKAELAYRWVGYNSMLKEEHGDAVVFGASSFKQLEETAEALKKGPVSKEAAERIEGVWRMVESEAEVDNWAFIQDGGFQK
jgi:aflatoxin B1 aldehyde reductase